MNIYAMLLFILMALTCCQKGLPTDLQLDNVDSIYGVRWFLGNSFSYKSQTTKMINLAEHYVLMFNSKLKIRGEIYLKIDNQEYACMKQHLTTNKVIDHHTEYNSKSKMNGIQYSTYLYKCNVNKIEIYGFSSIKLVPYSIVTGSISQNKNSTKYKINAFTEVILFSGTFRVPGQYLETKMIVIGDWGIITQIGQQKGYKHVMPCLLEKFNQNPLVTMLMFTGDMAYDMQGELYQQMLIHFQPISSQIVFLVAPGNHDTLYHPDTFELFTLSFRSPNWQEYINYFSIFRVGKTVFIEYNPQREAFENKMAKRFHRNLSQIFERQLSNEILQQIKNQYNLIVFSHYPIYCSNIYDDLNSCEKNKDRFEIYRQYFDKAGLDLYISGHLHLYERTLAICSNGTFNSSEKQNQNSDHLYGPECPIYIVEGDGGSNDYLQTTENYPLKDFSAKLSYNTGFGILTITNSNNASSFQFEHITTQSCSANDFFHKTNFIHTVTQQTANGNKPTSKVLLKIVAFIIVIGVFFGIYIFFKRRFKRVEGRQPRSQVDEPKIDIISSKVGEDANID